MSKKRVVLNKRKFTRFILCVIGVLCVLVSMVLFGCQKDKLSDERVDYVQGWKVAMSARSYISNDKLRYDEAYVDGGYPDDNKGVCTDVVWNAFIDLGVSIKYYVDKDIARYPETYQSVISAPDPNIDFRRVPVLEVFFARHGESLTTDFDAILAWQPGDIVTFESSHVAIVSGLRNIWGRPYVIQHGADPAAEEDRLWVSDGMAISGHYRWKW